MENKQDLDVQETQEEVKLSPKEYEDLKHRADVSSQNFTRLKAIEKERDDLKALIEGNQLSDDYVPDTALKAKVETLERDIQQQKSQFEMERLYTQYPALKENKDMFTTYSQDPLNADMPLPTRAKAFLVENDLLKEPSRRKGLEKTTGGRVTTPVAANGKMSAEDAKRLRTTDPRRYQRMIESGTLIIDPQA